MMGGDLFDDSNKFYRDAVDNPLKIIEPLGRAFFLEGDSSKRPIGGGDRISPFERGPSKMNNNSSGGMQNSSSNAAARHQNSDSGNSYNRGGGFPSQDHRGRAAKKLPLILIEKEKQLEQIMHNKVSQRQVDMKFLNEIKPETSKMQAALVSDSEYKVAVNSFDKAEFKKQNANVLDQVSHPFIHPANPPSPFQITIQQYQTMKALRCQNLLKLLTGFVKKTSQVSTQYHVYGSCENISYIEYLKREVELTLITSVLKFWLEPTEKMEKMQASPQFSEIDPYLQPVDDVDITSADSVRGHIANIKEQAVNVDFSWEGFDLYLGLRSCPLGDNGASSGYIAQEKTCVKRLLFDLAMVCNTLNDQQSCVVKFYNVFTCKTIQILYLFFKVFQTTVMCKPRTSSLSSNQRFLLCTGLKVDLARKLGSMILEKYDEYLMDNTLLFEMKLMTQDQKFAKHFIQQFLRNMVKLMVEYYECVEVAQKKYADIVKQEWQSVFAQPYYKEIVDTFEIEDIKLKRDLGLKSINLTDALNQIENEAKEVERSMKEQSSVNTTSATTATAKLPQFSDEEEERSDLVAEGIGGSSPSGLFIHQFLQHRQIKDDEENEQLEAEAASKRSSYANRLNNSMGRLSSANQQGSAGGKSKDQLVINQKDDRDLDFTKNLMSSIGVPLFKQQQKKKK